MNLESCLDSFPAKTTLEYSGKNDLGISVREHCLLSAYVLKALLNTFSFADKKAVLPDALPLIAAVHDIGKISPGFLRKLLKAVSEDGRHYPEWDTLLSHYPKAVADNHAYIGARALYDEYEDDDDLYRMVYEIVGSHHGNSQSFDARTIKHPSYGGTDWQEIRLQFIELQKKALGLEDFPSEVWSVELRNVWLGLVIVSDWIASRITRPLQGTVEAVARQLVEEAGFCLADFSVHQSFESIFHFQPRGIQKTLEGLYRGPGVYVLEAPTGCGKTEAALWLAYQALQRKDAQGIYLVHLGSPGNAALTFK